MRVRQPLAQKEMDMTEILSGQDLIDAGLRQGQWFGPALLAANSVLERGGSRDEALGVARGFEPAPALRLHAPGAVPFCANIEADNYDEAANVASFTRSMT